VFEAVFREFGMPQAIRTTTDRHLRVKPLVISRLSMWWLQLASTTSVLNRDVRAECDGHERMHHGTQTGSRFRHPAPTATQQQALTQFEWS